MAGTHAQKSPSGAERYHNCPGAIPLILTLPPEQRASAGRAAQLGTAAHGLLERCLGERTPPSSYKGRVIELIGEREDVSFLRKGAKLPKDKKRVAFVVDDEMVENVGIAYDYVLSIIEGEPTAKVFLEGRTNPLPDRDDTHGTADVTIDNWPFLLHVVDYKNGRMLVEHEDNEQLLSYLLGRAQEFGWDYEEYRITIVQPNAFHAEGRVRSVTVTAEDLRAFEVKHRAAVERVDEAADVLRAVMAGEQPTEDFVGTYLNAGPHCMMCNAMAICPAYRKKLMEEAKVDFADDPTEDFKFMISDPERAQSVLRWAPYMTALIRACNAYVMASMTTGKKVEGLKLVRGKSTRRWRDDMTPDQIAKALVKGGYLNSNEVAQLWTDPQLTTAPKAEKLIPADKRRKFNEEFITKPKGGLLVVPEDDPRAEVVVDPNDDFEADSIDEAWDD